MSSEKRRESSRPSFRFLLFLSLRYPRRIAKRGRSAKESEMVRCIKRRPLNEKKGEGGGICKVRERMEIKARYREQSRAGRGGATISVGNLFVQGVTFLREPFFIPPCDQSSCSACAASVTLLIVRTKRLQKFPIDSLAPGPSRDRVFAHCHRSFATVFRSLRCIIRHWRITTVI